MEKRNKTGSSIVSFGEVLWDTYPTYRKLGGAPFNVLGHLQQLGHSVDMISRVGDDHDGQAIMQLIRAAGVGQDHIQVDPLHPTGVVNVLLDHFGKPTYEIVQPSAWDYIEVTSESLEIVQQADVFICGTLAARNATSRESMISYLKVSNLTIVDLNLRLDFFNENLIQTLLRSADILKINDDEFTILAKMLSTPTSSLYSFMQNEFELDAIIQTKGAEGAEAFKNGIITSHKGYPIEVVDTVGSGDAFLAGFLSQYLEHPEIEQALDFGCRLGAYVATQPGAIPPHDGLS